MRKQSLTKEKYLYISLKKSFVKKKDLQKKNIKKKCSSKK